MRPSARVAPQTKALNITCTPASAHSESSTQLDGFGIEHDEDAAMALRAGDGAEPAQALHDLLGNAFHGLARLVAQRVQTAVGEHIAQRRRAAEAGALLEQDRACPAACRGDGGGGTGAAAADDGDVEWLTIHGRSPLLFRSARTPVRVVVAHHSHERALDVARSAAT